VREEGTSQMRQLLERTAAIAELSLALADAEAGRGGIVLISGEAGVGKTTLLKEFRGALPQRARVLQGRCDDLLTARALGPLRDAAAATGGPLAAALAGGVEVFDAAIAELSGPALTVLLVEDVHWADDATLDVLGYLARRVGALRALVVVTVRDGGAPDGHPLHRWLGALGPARRVSLEPLSVAAVGELAARTDWDPIALHTLTAGNPFFVTEVLAGASGAVPTTVADAVTARVARLSERCQQALAQLSVIPGMVPFELAEALPAVGLAVLGEAEERGILRVCQDGVTFRHELARRAIEQGLPVLRRRLLHREVITLLRQQSRPDLARLVHHASRAGEADLVAHYATLAGRESAAAGSHSQAVAHFGAAARYADRLEPSQRAALLDDYAWELHIAHRFTEAVQAGERAVALFRELGDHTALGLARIRLSRLYYLAGNTDAAESSARHAIEALAPAGSESTIAYAMACHGAILALAGDPLASPTLTRAHELATRCERIDLVELCLNYQSIAEPGLDQDERLSLMCKSLRLAMAQGHHELTARGFTNMAELCYLYQRFDVLEKIVEAGLEFTQERGFWSHAYSIEVYRRLLQLRRGDWAGAEAGLAALLDSPNDPGMLRIFAEPNYGRLLARRGCADAGEVLVGAWEYAQRQRSLTALAHAGPAVMEWAWLADQPSLAAAVLAQWRSLGDRPGIEPATAEVLRYAARAGLSVEAFPGCPQPWAAGLAGDWQAAAAGFAHDPYERALELASSGLVEPTLEALRMLDDLGATTPANLVRQALKRLGVRTIPRGPQASTKAHPAGLTSRQVDVLGLVVEGLTNAEIAKRLVLSVRTVDHHVSSILGKLGVSSRREARELATSLSA
jgi:ATP/maltotriose-dependent transcriptional regulator MalT